MRIQIVFIHGGTSFSSYDAFLNYLKTKQILDPFNVETQKRWKQSLYTEFGNTCDVFLPSMPNSQNAHYIEWKIWFERYFEYLTGEVILIGHSQGGYFLAKYLSENSVPFSIKALYLIATPFSGDASDEEDGGDFKFDQNNIQNIEKLTQNIVIMHSTDDPIVPVSHAKKYSDTLPSAKYILFEDKGHFLDQEFPEIIQSLKDLLK